MRNPEVQAALSDAELAWMAGLPGVVKVRDFSSSFGPKEIWVTHAGFLPKDHLHQPFKGLVRNRFLRASAKGWSPATNQDGKNFYKQPEGSVVWDEAWTGPRVIYGNIVHDLEHIRVVNDCWGIDTGVVFGGMLTAYVHNLQTSAVDIHQVKARQVYFKESQED
jgi:diadenosine tetraphosphatase ApaH/serine/threonine PP2A family protein phosphatase